MSNKSIRADRYANRVVVNLPENYSPAYRLREAWLAGYKAAIKDHGLRRSKSIHQKGIQQGEQK